MSAVLTERLVALAQEMRSAPHGAKSAIVAQAAVELGLSVPTLHRHLGNVALRPRRKRRSDAGDSALAVEEARLISAMLMESTRRNGKRLMSIEQATGILRSNGKILASCVDGETGEIAHLSTSTIARALRLYTLHPDQLMRPDPAIELASLHPNHVWEIDASLCVLYYLKREASTQRGLQVMDSKEFYKNKPRNVEKIVNDRVWRYLFTDHYSDTYYLEYVLGAESGENLATTFINAIQKRPDDPFHGVPFLAMMDPGSANTGSVFQNLAHALQIHVQVNTPGKPRSKGQVEKGHDIVERNFESGLKFVEVTGLDQLNALAGRWMRAFNGSARHSRHKQTRYAVWQTITEAQLRIAPSVELCRELAHTNPEKRQVNTKLRVSFKGEEFDVSSVPGVMVGEYVLMARNPWRPEAAQVVLTGEDGRELFHVVEPVLRSGAGNFATSAQIIGEGYSRHADTQAQTNAKAIERILTGADTLEQAAQSRKEKRLPMNGEIDPYKPVTDAVLPSWLPKRGTALDIPQQVQIEIQPLSFIQAALRLRAMMARVVTAEDHALIRAWHPDGVPEERLQEVADRLEGKLVETAPRLREGGGAAAGHTPAYSVRVLAAVK